MAELTEDQFDILRDAVNLARHQKIRSLPALQKRLAARGYDTGDINAALGFWARYEQDRGAPAPIRS